MDPNLRQDANLSEGNLRKLKRIVYLLIVLSIITFMSGFLKGTQFEHVSNILFFILFAGGVKLIVMASKIKAKRYLKFFLVMTGSTTILYMLLVVIALLMSMVSGLTLSDTLELLEGLFYLTSIPFIIGVIGSLVLLYRREVAIQLNFKNWKSLE